MLKLEGFMMSVRSSGPAWLCIWLAALAACAEFSPSEQQPVGSPVAAAPVSRAPAPAPGAESRQATLESVYRSLRANDSGTVYSGAVPGTRAEDFAVAVVTVDGAVASFGSDRVEFPLMSVSKPFTFAAALEQHGVAPMLARLGANATGMPYNSMAALVARPHPLQNPLVNTGAIAAHSFIQGQDSAAKLKRVIDVYSALAGRPLRVRDQWRATPRASSYALAYQMQHYGLLDGDVEDALQRYLLSNIVSVNVVDLAQMGAALANGGVQPATGRAVLSPDTVLAVLAVMVNAGMYEDSGIWWVEVGMPAKSGVSGAVLAVAPGWGAVAGYSPRLDGAGNSVRAGLAIRQLSERWCLHGIERLLGACGAQGAHPAQPRAH